MGEAIQRRAGQPLALSCAGVLFALFVDSVVWCNTAKRRRLKRHEGELTPASQLSHAPGPGIITAPAGAAQHYEALRRDGSTPRSVAAGRLLNNEEVTPLVGRSAIHVWGVDSPCH